MTCRETWEFIRRNKAGEILQVYYDIGIKNSIKPQYISEYLRDFCNWLYTDCGCVVELISSGAFILTIRCSDGRLTVKGISEEDIQDINNNMELRASAEIGQDNTQ